MAVETKRVAVVGVAGFVGQQLARTLLAAGWKVDGVTSARNRFLLEHLGLAPATGRYPVVINLAYPTGAAPLRRREDNAQIVHQIRELAAPGASVIHASTLAVFGFALEREPVCGPLRWRPERDYIESKVWMENQLVGELAAQHRVDIVRLGNVWGPGSPHWLAGLAHRLRAGLPVLAAGGGRANVTDVHNVAAYFGLLAGRPAATPGAFYHHLAEFSAEPWETFVQPVAAVLGCEPVSASPPPPPRPGGFLFGRVAVEAFRTVNDSPRLGSLLRQVLNRLPDSAIARMRREKLAAAAGRTFDEPSLAQVLSCPREFRTQVIPGWTPPVPLADALARAVAWLNHAGYSPTLTA